MLVGYIRVSTDDQNLSLQKDALLKYGVDERNIFSDKTSGSKDKRVGLDKVQKTGTFEHRFQKHLNSVYTFI